MTWRPRSSKVGAYFSCMYRAALDRAVHEGKLEAHPDESSSYADLGTLIHWLAMSEHMKLEFPDGKEAPTPKQIENAATLFNGNLDDLYARANHVGQRVARLVPPGDWLAETHYETPALSGSIDFISADGTAIGDLKTTSRKPEHGRIKGAHLYQILCYAILAETKGHKPEEGWVLYVGSLKDFDLLVRFRLDTPAMLKMRDCIRRYIDTLRGPDLYRLAVPVIGHHCEGEFCPHRAICRDKILPDPGESSATVSKPVTISNPFEGI